MDVILRKRGLVLNWARKRSKGWVWRAGEFVLVTSATSFKVFGAC